MSSSSESKPIAIVGGGPAGSIAALCLRRLGRDVVVHEKARFPRYRVGESLLPGTLSILARLGLAEEIEEAGYVKKRAATFIWNAAEEPWTFSLATPRTDAWTYDHAYQVDRLEFDRILLAAAEREGATVRESCEVKRIETGGGNGSGSVEWLSDGVVGQTEAAWIIDGSGRRGLVAAAEGSRVFDPFFKNMALWSYFEGGKRFEGDLEGNVFSVATDFGWVWIIPLKADRYSVGIVADDSVNQRIREEGLEAIYHDLLDQCGFAAGILAEAKRCDGVHATRDWAYEARSYAVGRTFLCGDAACFIDPLFSQGVHLAAYSAVFAAAAIDYLIDCPGESELVQAWYDESYRNAYNGYHEFLSIFYACNRERDSAFWQRMTIEDDGDERFRERGWFGSAESDVDEVETKAEEVRRRASMLGELWRHPSGKLEDVIDQEELALRRIRWANKRQQRIRKMKAIRWAGKEARLKETYKVDPGSFKLTKTRCLEDEKGRRFRPLAAREAHRALFARTLAEDFDFRTLTKLLKEVGVKGPTADTLVEMLEQGFLLGYDGEGKAIAVERPLRFMGVGATDPLA